MNTKKFKFPISALIIIVLSCIGNIPTFGEPASETTDYSNDGSEILPSDVFEESSANNPQAQLIVKLKYGWTLTDIQELNRKYTVGCIGEITDTASGSNNTLKKLKKELSELDAKYDTWYWQLEKGSSEYKNYIEKIEREKKELQEKIVIQEETLGYSGKTKEITPEDTPNFEYTYVLNVPENINIIQMAADYQINNAVEYAKPNYVYR